MHVNVMTDGDARLLVRTSFIIKCALLSAVLLPSHWDVMCILYVLVFYSLQCLNGRQ